MLRGSTVAILGGSSGIGLATARAAYRHGAKVVIAGRDKGRLVSAVAAIESPEGKVQHQNPGDNAEEFRERPGAQITGEIVDILDESEVRSWLEAVGDLEHLVVTAADVAAGRVAEAQRTEVAINIDSRLWGSFYAAKHALPRIADTGSITLFSGVSAWKPYPGEAIAAASAGAIEAFARSLAVEAAPVRVNAVCPGFVDTPLLQGFLGEQQSVFYEHLRTNLPARRVGSPDDIAHAVLFLMTNAYTTGTTLHVDGGYRLI